jgi:hypothetical protein
MAKIFWSIWLLVLVLGLATYSGLISKTVELVSNFNQYVIVFIPSELLFVFLLVWFWLSFRIYQTLTH